MIVSITYKNGYGGYTTVNRNVTSKRHLANLLDKFYNVTDVEHSEKEFNNLKDK